MMTQVTARIPDNLVTELDSPASGLRRSRAEVIRLAIEYYLDDFEDLRASISALPDPADPVLDWEAVRDELLDQD